MSSSQFPVGPCLQHNDHLYLICYLSVHKAGHLPAQAHTIVPIVSVEQQYTTCYQTVFLTLLQIR